MLRLLRRILARAKALPVAGRTVSNALTGQPPTDFAAFARVCKLQAAEPLPLDARDSLEDAVLGDQILAHYQLNRPGPESMPALSLQILNLVAAPSMDAQRLAALVSQDPALAANVLRMANSALYRSVSEIGTVRDAIARLGFEEVARLAGGVAARSLFNPRLRAQFASFDTHFKRLFQDALTAAMAASWLAMRKPAANSGRVYLGGLLHEVGKTIALRSVAALVAEGKIAPRPGAVPRILEQLHLAVGEDAMRAWSMPGFLVHMAAHHRDGEVEAEEVVDLSVVRLVSALRALRARDPHQQHAHLQLVQSAQVLGVNPFELRALDAELQVFAARSATLAG
jgi:HD-like signal output (HDOD) protein